jgi:hypothetical protein
MATSREMDKGERERGKRDREKRQKKKERQTDRQTDIAFPDMPDPVLFRWHKKWQLEKFNTTHADV